MGFDALVFIHVVLGVLGGLLAAAALVIAKEPDAKRYIDRLAMYQATIGVGLIAVSVINFLRMLGHITAMLRFTTLLGAAFVAMVGAGFLLGALFGMPQIAKWIPGDSPAEQKALELSRKLTPYQVTLGVVSVIASFVMLLYMLRIL
jgi:hypothetical protein